MPKKSKKEKTSEKEKEKERASRYDNDDALSVDSDRSMDNVGEEEVIPMTADEKLSETIEKLTDKKPAIRLTALTALNASLTTNYLKGFLLENRLVTVIEYLLQCVKKADSEETIVVCRSLCLVSFTMGLDGEGLYEKSEPVLVQIIKNQARSDRARAAAALALGVICFASSPPEDEKAVAGCMELFRTMYSESKNSKTRKVYEVNEQLIAQCLESWGLLASTLPLSKLAGCILDTHLPMLYMLLDHKSLDIRTAAGENIALLFDAEIMCTVENVVPDFGPLGKRFALDKKELVGRLETLAHDGQKFRGRKERAVQRSVFRNIVETVKEGEIPSETIKIGLSKFDFSGWIALLRLATIRQVLLEGFLFHMSNNELMSEIFDMNIMAPAKDPLRDKETKKQVIEASRAKIRTQKEKNVKARQRKVAHLQDDE